MIDGHIEICEMSEKNVKGAKIYVRFDYVRKNNDQRLSESRTRQLLS